VKQKCCKLDLSSNIKHVKSYAVIVYTGGIYYIFPKEWLFKNNNAIFCPQNVDNKMPKNGIFLYKNTKDHVHAIGYLRGLWTKEKALRKEIKYQHYKQKANFEVYFWKGSFLACLNEIYPEQHKKYKQLRLIDRKIMTFGKFLKYFRNRTEKEGGLAWDCYTKKHFSRKLSAKQPKRVPDKGNIVKKLLETIAFIEGGKTVHITKVKSLNRIYGYYGEEAFYGFAQFIANKILSYFERGESLCATKDVSKEQKEKILRLSVEFINQCFDATACDIDLPKKIEEIFDEICELTDSKRLYAHVTRTTLRDPDLQAMRECLGYFINNRDKYPGFWKREYDIAKYYCVSYSDLRFRLQAHSIPRIRDILEFVTAACVED
jgi:hypothetical protein